MRYPLSLDERSRLVLASVLRSALDEAEREGRTGVWVDDVRQIYLAMQSASDAGPEVTG